MVYVQGRAASFREGNLDNCDFFFQKKTEEFEVEIKIKGVIG